MLRRSPETTAICLAKFAALARFSIDHVPGVYPLLRIPSDAVSYFTHPTTYDTANAQRDLAGSGIAAPSFRDYAPRLVEFVRAHPDVGAAGMA